MTFPADPAGAVFDHPRLIVALSFRSPCVLDGKRVAVTRIVNGNVDVWLIDAARGVPTRFTFDPALDQRPVWSPDGSRIVFHSTRKGVFNLYWKLSSGAGTDELLLESDQQKAPSDWSSDGRFLLFRSIDPQTGFDLWVLPVSGDKKPFPFLKTSFEERNGQFSPDGKWIAYQSNESGRFEIYVQPFHLAVQRHVEDFFAVLVPVAGGPVSAFNKQQYAVSPDGQRFLVSLATDEAASPITLIYNWKPKQ